MNTNHTHQIRTATLATVIAFVAYAGTTAPAFAAHTHDDGRGRLLEPPHSRRTPSRSRLSAEMTLAEYIKNHHDGDHRTHTVV